MARKLNGIELTRYDDLFKTDAERETDQQERVQIVPAEQVFPYARQPYSVDRPITSDNGRAAKAGAKGSPVKCPRRDC